MQRGKQQGRIPIDIELRNLLQAEKRGQENWTELLRRIYTEWRQLKEKSTEVP